MTRRRLAQMTGFSFDKQMTDYTTTGLDSICEAKWQPWRAERDQKVIQISVGLGGGWQLRERRKPVGGSAELQGILGRTHFVQREGKSLRGGGNEVGKDGGRECRLIKSNMWIIANICVGSKATYHHHHDHYCCSAHLSVLQQSRNFVIVGEVKVAIETDACCPSLLLLLLSPHPLLLTFSPWAVSSQHISQQFLPTVYVCSDYVKHAQSTTHSFFFFPSEAVDHISPSLKYRGEVTVQLP